MRQRKTLVSLVVLLTLGTGAAAWAETSITTANTSDDADTDSGDATSSNSAATQVGHNGGGETDVTAEDIDNEDATNVQEGDNSADADQSANSESGAAVTGQVVGGVADGDLTIDATNSTTDSSAESGDADSTNSFAAFVGLDASSSTAIAADVTNAGATNVQEGDNSIDANQSSNATTGDGVAGQVLGGVATGTVDLVSANTSEDSDATSGDSDETSESSTFTGLHAVGVVDVV